MCVLLCYVSEAAFQNHFRKRSYGIRIWYLMCLEVGTSVMEFSNSKCDVFMGGGEKQWV